MGYVDWKHTTEKNNTVITKFKEACIYNDKEEDAYKKQPIGFKVTNKHD